MAKKHSEVKSEACTFEAAMEDLETIVRRLEQGGGPLEEALTDYSKAIGLLKSCNGQLNAAERRIEILSGVDAQGNPVVRPLDDADASLVEKQQTRSQRRSAGAGKERGDEHEEMGLF